MADEKFLFYRGSFLFLSLVLNHQLGRQLVICEMSPTHETDTERSWNRTFRLTFETFTCFRLFTKWYSCVHVALCTLASLLKTSQLSPFWFCSIVFIITLFFCTRIHNLSNTDTLGWWPTRPTISKRQYLTWPLLWRHPQDKKTRCNMSRVYIHNNACWCVNNNFALISSKLFYTFILGWNAQMTAFLKSIM